MKKIRMARIVTVPIAFVHIEHMIAQFQGAQFEVTLICSPTEDFEIWKKKLGVEMIPLEIPRPISLLKDLKALITLTLLFRREQFDLVHSSTPKAGLLTALAGFFARVPVRFHTFTGQRWATMTGFSRSLFIFLDKVIVKMNTHCFADSPSQVRFLIDNKIGNNEKLSCLGSGSYGGVNFKRFYIFDENKKNILREKLNLKQVFRFMYLGRVVKDKGIHELIWAFEKLAQKNSEIELLIIGPTSGEDDHISAETMEIIKNHPQINWPGSSPNPEEYLNLSDVLVIPSYREGFGTVVLEAAACGIPCIGTRIPGLVDSVQDGVTGFLVEKQNREQLFEIMNWAVENRSSIRQAGEKAWLRTKNDFSSDRLAQLTIEAYKKSLATKRGLI